MRKTIKPYLFLAIFLLILMSLSPLSSEKIREKIVRSISSLPIDASHALTTAEVEIQKLRLENQTLKSEMQRLKSLVHNERKLMKSLKINAHTSQEFNEAIKQHFANLQQLMTFQFLAAPAKVIFRSTSSWKSSLWVNVGRSTNKTLNRNVIAKNSPVVVGNTIVGVIDYVGEQQSRIRLISDSGLSPSVRAARGSIQKSLLCDSIDLLADRLEAFSGSINSTAKGSLLSQLDQMLNALKEDEGETWYLAKGELHGSKSQLWRSSGALLQGVGFNYDFPDEYGPARDLRSGIPLNSKTQSQVVPLLKEHDVLVTTGMDGVFPAGLYVAEIVKIDPLEEGDYTYNLEARPIAGNLEELSLVYVIPPLGYDPQDQPPPVVY